MPTDTTRLAGTAPVSLAEALREAADLIDAHPDLPHPYVTSSAGTAGLQWFLNSAHPDDEAMQAAVSAHIQRTFYAGRWERATWSNTEQTYTTQTRGRLHLMIVTGKPHERATA